MKNRYAWVVVHLLMLCSPAWADMIISQYVETDSGTSPKGIEIWNSGATAVDFTVNNLQIFQGTNGNAMAQAGATINTGSLASGDVLVIGTSDIGTYLSNQGLGTVRFVSFNYSFNGNDSLQIRLGGVAIDTFGIPGVDPVTAWTGSGVSTANQNIQLLAGISSANSVGFSDPSTRFMTVSTSPTSANGLTGFGVAPTAVPEPTSIALVLIFGAGGVGISRMIRAGMPRRNRT